MEPQARAIAALKQVTELTTHHRDMPGKIASSGIDMTSTTTYDAIVPTKPGAHEPTQVLEEPDRLATRIDERRGYLNDATVELPSNTSDDNSQSTTDSQDAATPPTSTSEGFSSQSTNQDGTLSQLSQLSQLAAARQPLQSNNTRPKLAISPTAGQKRTADGQVKGTNPDPQISSNKRGHSRDASAVSNVSTASSRIGEISAELRVRLSYAMVKVNNGWQSNSIDEVESLASQAGSPTSSSSTAHGRRNLITSPREALASVQGQTGGPNTIVSAPADFDLYSATGQPTRTYESFWRDHSVANNSQSRYSSQQSNASPPQSRGLAPPADIRPTPNSRRSGTPKSNKPPTIPSQNSNSSLRTSTPRTPNRGDYPPNAIVPTPGPTQKTIQEQDAIETLLFMSSPGNSGNMAHTFPPRSQASPQQSPLRSEFRAQQSRPLQEKKVGFDVAAASERFSVCSASSGVNYRRHRGGPVASTGEREAAVDQMIQDYDSSSDEEDMVLKFTSPRITLATGR